MRKEYHILKNIKGLNLIDKTLLNIFIKYTYKIYSAGVKDGFYFND